MTVERYSADTSPGSWYGPHGAPVSALIRAAATAAPSGRAVQVGDQTWSYRELMRAVDDAAWNLVRAGVGPGDLVALCTNRCPELVLALLAVFELDAAAVPLHESLGAARLEEAIERLSPRVALADAEHRHILPAALAIESLASRSAGSRPSRPPIGGLGLACILHTSGSTGIPKAVMLTHAALANRLAWGQSTYPLARGDVVLHHSVPVFDFALWELLAPLCFGATLAIAPSGAEAEPSSLAALLRDYEVTCAHFVPSLLATFLAEAGGVGLERLRYLFCGGEALSPALAAKASAATPATLFNQYGPTETTIDCTAWRMPSGWTGDTVPIGAPISDTAAYVLDGDLARVSDAETGVLHISGAGLAWGYHRNPRATAEAFLPDPFSEMSGSRMYRTGDLAICRDGILTFTGRIDDQVKIRGVRVEPTEVERVLTGHSDIQQAAVVAVDRVSHVSLAAHFVSTNSLAAADLRRFLAGRLPAAAIPDELVSHDALPRLASGKIDRLTLTQLPAAQPNEPGDRGGDPRSETEMALVEIWKTLLENDEVGPRDDFFTIGGHSLLAIRLIARIRATFGVRLAARTIFDSPTIESLAPLIERARAEIAP